MPQIGTGHWLVHLSPLGRGGICPDVFVLLCLTGVSVSLTLCVCLCECAHLSLCCLEGKGVYLPSVSQCSEFYLCFLIIPPTPL